MTRKTRADRVRENILRNKESVRRLVNNGALSKNEGIADIEFLLRQIKRDREYLNSVVEEKDIIQRFEEFTRWGRASEDGDWVFMDMRKDELRNAEDKWRRAQRRERRMRK